MKAIGYIRVSTEEQSKEGISLELQTNKIKAYCDLNDLEFVDVVCDAGISAKSIQGRPGIQRVLEMVRAKEIDAVVVYKLDRFARNTMDCLEMAAEFDKSGVALHSITEKLDTQSAIGRFFFTLLSALAEMERSLIQERVSSAMQHCKRNGLKTGSQAPYGYRWVEGRAEEDEAEQACLELLRGLHDSNPKLSLRKLSTELEKHGCVNRKGLPFSAESIKGMLGAS